MGHPRCSGARAPAWLLVAAVSMAACSASTSQQPSPASTSAPAGAGASTAGATTSAPSSTHPEEDAVVGEADSGTRVLLRPGQRLRVALGADFTPLEVPADGVLNAGDADGGYPTGQPLTTVLTAVAPGEVSLSSSTDAACLHDSPPCSVPQQEWTLSVAVVAG